MSEIDGAGGDGGWCRQIKVFCTTPARWKSHRDTAERRLQSLLLVHSGPGLVDRGSFWSHGGIAHGDGAKAVAFERGKAGRRKLIKRCKRRVGEREQATVGRLSSHRSSINTRHGARHRSLPVCGPVEAKRAARLCLRRSGDPFFGSVSARKRQQKRDFLEPASLGGRAM